MRHRTLATGFVPAALSAAAFSAPASAEFVGGALVTDAA